MRRLALPLSAAALIGVAGCPGTQRDLSEPPRDADTNPPDVALESHVPVPVRVLTWNVKNLYNDVRDSPEVAVADEMIVPLAEYQAKLDAIAGVLTALSPDIAVLQEVENQTVLTDLANKLGGYPHRHITQGNDPRGIDIALLSRHPIADTVAHDAESFQSSASGQTYTFARDVLEAHFSIGGRQLVLFGIHFKSGTEAFDQDKRLAEAEQTRAIVSQVDAKDPSAAVIVLGDFNTNFNTPPMAALAGVAPSQLVSATAALSADDRFSVTFGGTPQLYDDQLIDPEAASALDPVSVAIDHGSTVNAAADHDPVVASYVLD